MKKYVSELHDDTKDGANQLKNNSKDSIISGLKGMRPGYAMQVIASMMGQSASAFFAKHLGKILFNSIKSGKIKTADFVKSIKEFDDKNVEDNSGIDWDNIQIDPSGMSFKCIFDGNSKKLVDQFMETFESSMKGINQEIKQADDKLHKEVKSAGVNLDDKTVDQNGIVVATAIDDAKKSGKSGKELTTDIQQQIDISNNIKKIKRTSRKVSQLSDQLKIDPELSKMSDDQANDKLQTIEQNINSNKKNIPIGKLDSLLKSVRTALVKKIGKDYKRSLKIGMYDKAKLAAEATKNKLKRLNIAQISSDDILCIKIQFLGDESKHVISEADDQQVKQKNQTKPGYRLKTITVGEKNKKRVLRIYQIFASVIQTTLGDNLVGDVVSYLKYWKGPNPDNKPDTLFVFAGVKSDEKSNRNSDTRDKLNEADNVPDGFIDYGNNVIVPSISMSSLLNRISSYKRHLDDGTIDDATLDQLAADQTKLVDYMRWAQDNADSSDPMIIGKITQIKLVAARFDDAIVSNVDKLADTLKGESVDETLQTYCIGDGYGVTPKQAKLAIDTADEMDSNLPSDDSGGESVPEQTASGWKHMLGIDTAITTLGFARLVAKTTGVVLNHGKDLVNMFAAQSIKRKEDANIIAELRCIISNGENGESNLNDTKFSVRLDANDCKWHATCLDNRKMKFPEDKLIDAVFSTEYGKKFKQHCMSIWNSIFCPDGSRADLIPFIIKNAEKLGLSKGKISKSFINTIQLMSDKYDEIQAVMK